MRPHGGLDRNEDANAAALEAAKGAGYGAVRWGIPFAVLGVAGYFLSPVYRGLTVQFKVFLQMSGMTLGSMIEADRRLRDYEKGVRLRKSMRQDERVWKAWEQSLENSGVLDEKANQSENISGGSKT
ncbi:MAG: hypothetical protein M1824_006469 [Vezdaea acicularis]|nr:MAG: hypothetical protein M1824_006469 [Vezdaea acicularis]